MTRTLPEFQSSTTLDKGVDVAVVGLAAAAGRDVFVGIAPELDKAYRRQFHSGVEDLARSLGASSEPERVVVLPAAGLRVLVVGLGDVDVTPTQVRRATGAALRAVGDLPDAVGLSVAVCLELADPELVQAAGEGALLGAYAPERLTTSTTAPAVSRITLVTVGDDFRACTTRAAAIAAAVWQARDWVNLPPNLLYPQSFAERVRRSAAQHRVAVEVLDEKALARGGYGGILAVGGGSARAPRLVRLEHAPRGATRHLALVGKGITFDSGGLDLKPAGQMAGMKYDMAGAAAVIAAVQAIAALGLGLRVTAYAALAENLPSGSAYRSSDVLTMYGGQTVENYNTDAEGRLVMADAIARAGEDEPDLIVDVATLTGACMVGLGLRTGGLMASDDATADHVLDAAETAGEDFWQLPITDDARAALTSDIADLRSGGKHRWGGALVAAAFLQRFVPDGVAWAHLDIAGPANNDEAAFGCTPKGGTGVGVRTLVALATRLAR